MRFAVFGDTGGHLAPLTRSLVELGIDLKNFMIPEDLTIIHLGDLVHRGPQSSMIVAIVDRLIKNNPKSWVQIMGNHELMHFTNDLFFPCNCSSEATKTIVDWFENDEIHFSAAIGHVNPTNWTNSGRPIGQEKVVEKFLFTHAGLTKGFKDIHGLNDDPNALSFELNSLSLKNAAREGLMIQGVASLSAGPMWAESVHEVFNSWSGHTPPFSQVFGHSTPFIHNINEWRNGVTKEFKKSSKVIPSKRSVMTSVNGKFFFAADPGFGVKNPDVITQPFMDFEGDFLSF